jgi:hypothetical protein
VNRKSRTNWPPWSVPVAVSAVVAEVAFMLVVVVADVDMVVEADVGTWEEMVVRAAADLVVVVVVVPAAAAEEDFAVRHYYS